MRRTTILLVVAAMAMAIALPAEAKKPPKPTDPPTESTYYTVDIAVTPGTDGVTTSCGSDVVVRRDGIHFEWYYDPDEPRLPEDIELNVAATDLRWLGALVSGCRNAGSVETYGLDGALPETSPAPGYFRITLEDDGTVAMLWIFDIYERYDEVKLGKKRVITDLTERTDFRMGGPYVDGDFAQAEFATDANGEITGTATGTFCFVHYVRGGDPLFTELDNDNWCQTFTLDITLTPR